MALARASSSTQDNNAYCLSYDRGLHNNVSLTQSTCTPMSQPSLLQNNTQTVQVNEFIDNISRNTTYHGSHSFSFENSIDTTGEDEEPLLLDDVNDDATENILIPNWYNLDLASLYDALNPFF